VRVSGKTVVVTGGTGFLGTHVAKELGGVGAGWLRLVVTTTTYAVAMRSTECLLSCVPTP